MYLFFNKQKYLNKNLKELWDLRKEFYPWVIGTFVGLIVILGLYIATLTLWVIDKDAITSLLSKKNNTSNNNSIGSWSVQIVYLSLYSLFTSLAIYSLVQSILKSFKLKTFGVISLLPTMIIFFASLSTFFWLIQIVNYGNINEFFESSIANSIYFSINFVYVFIWLFFSRNLSQTRLIFMIAQQKEAYSAWEKFQQSGQSIDIFTKNANNQTTTNEFYKKNNQQNIIMEETTTYKRLMSISKRDLNAIAQRFSISGYENMTKEELVKIIWQIDHSMHPEKYEKEIKSQPIQSSENEIEKNNELNDDLNKKNDN